MKSRAPWVLDPEVVFLNHGSFGGCAEPVLAEQTRLRQELERRPIEWLGPERDLEPKLDRARAAMAEVVGARPRDLVFVPNATSAVNAVLRSFAFEAGDEIVFSNHGYNACNNAVRFVAERCGAIPVIAEIPFPLASPDMVVEALEKALSTRTRLVLIDHITSTTALVLPIQRLVALCRERGIRVMVDGAHAVGMVPLDLEALGADYYTSNAHKWLCAPKTCAFLHVREELQEEVRPLVISHAYNTPRPGYSRFEAEFAWPGTYDATPYLTLPFAIDWLAGQHPEGLAGVREQNRGTALAARDLLCEALGIEAPCPDEMIGSMASVPLPDGPPPVDGLDGLHVRLFRDHGIEVPVPHWPQPGKRWIRVSAQLHNDLDDYRALVRALGDEGVLP